MTILILHKKNGSRIDVNELTFGRARLCWSENDADLNYRDGW